MFLTVQNLFTSDPCPNNFSRIGHNCYLISSNAGRELDWKAANRQCKRNGGTLTEMETIEENQDIVAHIQNTPYLRGKSLIQNYRICGITLLFYTEHEFSYVH